MAGVDKPQLLSCLFTRPFRRGAAEIFKNTFQEVHLLIYGVLIVLVVLFLPEGIVGSLSQYFRRPGSPPPLAVGQAEAAPCEGAGVNASAQSYRP